MSTKNKHRPAKVPESAPANSAKTGEKKKMSEAFLARTWKPGQSGNPKGRPSLAPFTEAIKKCLREDVSDGETGFDAIARAMLNESLKGNVKAALYLTERLEGRAIQSVLVSKPEDALPPGERLKAVLEFARQRKAEAEKERAQ